MQARRSHVLFEVQQAVPGVWCSRHTTGHLQESLLTAGGQQPPMVEGGRTPCMEGLVVCLMQRMMHPWGLAGKVNPPNPNSSPYLRSMDAHTFWAFLAPSLLRFVQYALFGLPGAFEDPWRSAPWGLTGWHVLRAWDHDEAKVLKVLCGVCGHVTEQMLWVCCCVTGVTNDDSFEWHNKHEAQIITLPQSGWLFVGHRFRSTVKSLFNTANRSRVEVLCAHLICTFLPECYQAGWLICQGQSWVPLEP